MEYRCFHMESRLEVEYFLGVLAENIFLEIFGPHQNRRANERDCAKRRFLFHSAVYMGDLPNFDFSRNRMWDREYVRNKSLQTRFKKQDCPIEEQTRHQKNASEPFASPFVFPTDMTPN